MLDVRRLRVLREVARRGSLSAAAEVLSYTPSAVSQQIATLERETGSALLERRARGVVLTEAGNVLVEHAEAILARVAAAEAALTALTEVRRGRLRMASFATAGATVLPRALNVFRARHPEIEVTVGQASPRESVEGLRAGRLDLALTADLDPEPAEGVVTVPLFEDAFQLALPAGHPLAAASAVAFEDLAAETWVDVPGSASGGGALKAVAAVYGFTPRIAFESDEYTAVWELVRARVGLALVPRLALHPSQDGVVLRDLGPDGPRRSIQAATRAPAFRSPAAEAMLDILRTLGPANGAGTSQPAVTPPSR